MRFIDNTAKTKHFEFLDTYLHLMTPTIQDGCQHIMQRVWQPSWILGSPSANRVITLNWDAFVVISLKVGHSTLKIGTITHFFSENNQIQLLAKTYPCHNWAVGRKMEPFHQFFKYSNQILWQHCQIHPPPRVSTRFALGDPRIQDGCHILCIICWQPFWMVAVIKS